MLGFTNYLGPPHPQEGGFFWVTGKVWNVWLSVVDGLHGTLVGFTRFLSTSLGGSQPSP